MSNPETNGPTRLERLELDIDLRVIDLYQGDKSHKGLVDALEEAKTEEEKRAIGAAFIRAAYGRGYVHAHTDPLEENLFTTNNLKIPKRKGEGPGGTK